MTLEDKIKRKIPVIIVCHYHEDDFEASCKKLFESGYRVSSTSCGFINDAEYDYCISLQAIFVLEGSTND